MSREDWPKTWRGVFEAFGPLPGPEAPCRSIFWTDPQNELRKERLTRAHHCPVALVDGIVEHVRRVHGEEPVEILPNDGLVIDPGGPVFEATRKAKLQLPTYTVETPIYCAPALLDWALKPQRGDSGRYRTYGDVAAFRFPCQHSLTVVLVSDGPAIVAWLRSLVTEADVIAATARARLGPPGAGHLDLDIQRRPMGEG